MSMQSPTDAESFYKFLGHTLTHGERETPPEALLRKWREQREHEETVEAVREGMADIEAGRFQTLEDFDRGFRAKNGLPPRTAS